MIRFAAQPAKPPVETPARASKTAVPSGEVPGENAGPLASLLLIPELDESLAATPVKTGKPRGPKKQKTIPEVAAIQLDLNT